MNTHSAGRAGGVLAQHSALITLYHFLGEDTLKRDLGKGHFFLEIMSLIGA